MSVNGPIPYATRATYKLAMDTINAAAIEVVGKTVDELIADSQGGVDLDMGQIKKIMDLAVAKSEANKDESDLARLGFCGVLQ